MTSNIEPRAERSVGELLGTLSRETGNLLRQEFQLASTEMTAKASRAAHAGYFLAAGGAAVHLGVTALLAALVLGLAQLMAAWLAALIVGVVVVVAGYLVLRVGVQALRHIDPLPREALREMGADTNLIKESIR